MKNQGHRFQRWQRWANRSYGVRGLTRLARNDINFLLLATMLLLALVPVGIVSLSAQRTLSSTLTDVQKRALLEESAGAADQIDRVLSRDVQLVDFAAKNTVYARYIASGLLDRRAMLDQVSAPLKVALQEDPAFNTVGVLDFNGTWVAAESRAGLPGTVGVVNDTLDFFLAAKAGRPFVSNIQFSSVTKQPSIYFSAPIRDEAGQVVGVLAARSDTTLIEEAFTRGSAGRETMIVDTDGIILLHSTDQRLLYRSVAPLGEQQQAAIKATKRFGSADQGVESLDVKGFSAAFRELKPADSFTYNLAGNTYYAAMVPVARAPWNVVATLPASVFAGPVNAQTQRNLLLGLVVAVIAVGAGLAVTRRVTGPLNELERAASRIGAGDYDTRVSVQGDNQLARLGRTVNAMVDQVTANARAQAEQNTALQRQIVQLLDEVSAVAEGDLTVEAEVSADSLGAVADSFNYMTAELRQIIGRVNEATHQVGVSTNTILGTAGALAAAAGQQAARIAETGGAVEEMAGSIEQVSRNATTSAEVARQARESAMAGSQAVAATVAGMGRIRAQVQETAKKIKRLGESSQEIGQAVQLIEEIARRTNRLALNAAIQAAMAGEHGKGFAVVAEEVRRLAERTGEASKQIDTLVKGIQAETTEAVAAMEEGTREVVGGSQVADEAGRSLQAIDQIVAQLAALIEQISQAAEQQAHASAGIARAMNELSEVTRETSSGAEQASVSVVALARLADDLRGSVAAFRLEATRPARAATPTATSALVPAGGNGHTVDDARLLPAGRAALN